MKPVENITRPFFDVGKRFVFQGEPDLKFSITEIRLCNEICDAGEDGLCQRIRFRGQYDIVGMGHTDYFHAMYEDFIQQD